MARKTPEITTDEEGRESPPVEGAPPDVERGTYEIIRGRLESQARTLRQRTQALNERRLELFGSTELVVIGNERIRTQNNCVPRDIVAVGSRLLFGYNVYIGLRTETAVEDVFSLHHFEASSDGSFTFEPVTEASRRRVLEDEGFVRDFKELYKYYKGSRLLQLRNREGKLLAVFQTGASLQDIRVFRWSFAPDGTATYIDNRGERDHEFPPSHDFEWTPTRREEHVAGRHPHVNILDEVFVETVGGDLTVKVENNTEDGQGIYSEPVEDANQSLDDAEIHYVRLGSLIALKVLPFREETWRHLVFNTRTRTVQRIDAIGQSCVQLPEDHGIIFPGGYYLQSGETKTFGGNVAELEFQRVIRSPNGEDVLYLFHHRDEGRTVMLPYNLIRKEVQNPIECHGYSLFEDGKMVIFRAQSDEPTRVHPMQIWQTPFTSDEHAAAAPSTGSYLEKVGNAELVRGISDALSLCRAIESQEPSLKVYEDLIASATRLVDSYFWLEHEEVGDLLGPLQDIRSTADLIVGEFEKVEAIRRQARQSVSEAEGDLDELLQGLELGSMTSIDAFVEALSELRRRQGQLITLRELRYVDLERLGELEARVVERFESASAATVDFLLDDESLAPYHRRLAQIEERIAGVSRAAEATALGEELDSLGEGLDLLYEVLSGLEIADGTVRTRILEGVSEVMGGLNRTRALLANHRKELLSTEAVAEFGVQFKLFGQNVTSALALADTPEKCDEQLSRLMLQLEELEGHFSEFDEFLEKLATRREEAYEAFTSKRQRLLDERQRRADQLAQAGERILEGIARRGASFGDEDDLNTFFASDPMVARLRDLCQRLRDLGASVRADELAGRLKSSREDAARGLKDRREIFEEGAEVIRLGRHRFSVNTQALDLTLVPRGDAMDLYLTGTDFRQPLDDPEFEATREFWRQTLVSETLEVYRGEFLAASILADAEGERQGLSLAKLRDAVTEDRQLLELVRAYCAQRYDEGYERGIHDADGALVLAQLLHLYQTAGLLRFAPRPRALACLFWVHYPDKMTRALWQQRATSLARLRSTFAHTPEIDRLTAELAQAVTAFFADNDLEVDAEETRIAGSYLFEEISRERVRFAVSAEAVTLRDAFVSHLEAAGSYRHFSHDLEELKDDLTSRYQLALAWTRALVQEAEREGSSVDGSLAELVPAVEGAVVLLLVEGEIDRDVANPLPSVRVEGLLGQHPRIEGRSLTLRLDEFLARLGTFRLHRVPGFRRYQELRHRLLETQRHRLRLSEYQPRVMSAFVRNRLINEVYLPLIGDNLAKQMGALGEGRRTDQMGLLLLISPPGYGKTTLMEYVANRLGLIFMKINGPSLGHGVTSIDPGEAPNATARQEVEKINLALEMGNNVLLYLDDIQHTHPELLQKFISLCDAQRRVEGVWRGETRTYDFRGKRFCVCMAGNPYTESGEKFQIPDMLANRADVYNLGDILEGRDEVFALSYLENALTSNPVLAPLTTRPQDDVFKLVRMARGEEVQADQLSHPYSAAELEEILSVLGKLLKVETVLLEVNRQYILSASQDDAFRTEPRFQLQGSYRNMNKLAERIVPVMNDEELEALIDDHYAGEAQTLTTGAEHNLLKLAELRGRMSDEERRRWEEIKRSFVRVQAMGGDEDDPVARVVGQLGLMSDRLAEIGGHIGDHIGETSPDREAGDGLRAVLEPVLTRLDESFRSLAEVPKLLPGPSPQPTAPPVDLAPYLDGLNQTLANFAERSAQPTPPASPPSDLTPYLDQLNETLHGLATAPRGGEIVQTLPPGVYDLMTNLVSNIDQSLMPAVRALGRRIEDSEDEGDRYLGTQIDRTLKGLDQLKDLLESLRRIETRSRVVGEGGGVG